MSARWLRIGDPAPWFRGVTAENPNFAFDTTGGRYVLMGFLGALSEPGAAAALAGLRARRVELFDDRRATCFVVSTDPDDLAAGRLGAELPGLRYFQDFDRALSRRFGVAGPDGAWDPCWLLLDAQLRVLGVWPLAKIAAALDRIAALPPMDEMVPTHAPVLVVPRVFEPEFCRGLIALYEGHGGEDSGFMREVDGKTVSVTDHGHKRRADHRIDDEKIRLACRQRIERRVVPQIARAFQFSVTRMERYIVACYDGDTQGHFRAHRDNTTKGTAHRRFAVTVNLNAEDYAGGDLSFPEFGSRTYRAPTGGAIVFSCSLLHEVAPVTRGRRYAFLPFLYDEAAAELREANNAYLGAGVGAYRRGGDGPKAA